METSLLSALCKWLEHPTIEVRHCATEELIQLRRDLEQAQQNADRAMVLYSQEVTINLTLEDELRRHGIKNPLKKR